MVISVILVAFITVHNLNCSLYLPIGGHLFFVPGPRAAFDVFTYLKSTRNKVRKKF